MIRENKENSSIRTFKQELAGRIIFAVLCLVAIVWMLIVQSDLIRTMIFTNYTILIIVLNNVFSYVIRKKHPEITREKIDELYKDRYYGPAVKSRMLLLALSFIGGCLLFGVSVGSGVLHPLLFFAIGYIFYTMIQFKKL